MTILLLGDLTGRNRVALRMLTFELEKRGHEVLMLPTVLISNTLNLGRAAMLDTIRLPDGIAGDVEKFGAFV